MWWLSSSCHIYIYIYIYRERERERERERFFFSLQRNEDRKTALLNLLSVKGLLGIFSMWRKIRKSPELLPSGWSHRLFPHSPWVSSFLIRDSGVAAARLPTSAKKGNEAWKWKTNTRKHRAPSKCQLFCLRPSKRLRFVWKWMSRPAALGLIAAVKTEVYFCVCFAEVAWWGPRS